MRLLALALLAAGPGCARAPCVVDANQPACETRFLATELTAWRLDPGDGTFVRTARLVGDDELGTDWHLDMIDAALVLGFPEARAVATVDLTEDPDACPPSQTRSLTWIPDDSLSRAHRVQVRSGACDREDPVFTGPADFGARVVPWPRQDGRWDLWVSAPSVDLGAGAVWRFDDAGDPATPRTHVLAGGTLRGTSPGDGLGARMVRCGDLDGDGQDELALGLPDWTDTARPGGVAVGAVVLLTPDALPSGDGGPRTWTLDEATAVHIGESPGDRLGEALLCDADLDGDGQIDLALGAPGVDGAAGEDVGAVYLVRGGRVSARRPIAEVATLRWDGDEPHGLHGSALAAADLDDDGAQDLIVGGPGSAAGAGAVDPERGGRTGAIRVLPGARLQQGDLEAALFTGPVGTFPGLEHHPRLGTRVGGFDVDGEPGPEILGGAWQASPGDDLNAGSIFVWRGEPVSTLAGSDAPAATRLDGDSPHDQVGRLLLPLDVDDDGRLDLVTSARR